NLRPFMGAGIAAMAATAAMPLRDSSSRSSIRVEFFAMFVVLVAMLVEFVAMFVVLVVMLVEFVAIPVVLVEMLVELVVMLVEFVAIPVVLVEMLVEFVVILVSLSVSCVFMEPIRVVMSALTQASATAFKTPPASTDVEQVGVPTNVPPASACVADPAMSTAIDSASSVLLGLGCMMFPLACLCLYSSPPVAQA
ncbi:MAG: hypothetical protein OEX19_15490, partial [Gammaproteobacteria bacterium]|nr:hypothetical protein [Gammaproteobacteria bacterium]